jgi:hypothetical protein
MLITDQAVFTYARLWFQVRTRRDDLGNGGWLYEHVNLNDGAGGSGLRASVIPAIGDVVILYPFGTCKVIDRMWHYPSLGSVDWPYTGPPRDGPIIDMICERCEGVYVDGVSEPEDD